jgi:hypothetical protein
MLPRKPKFVDVPDEILLEIFSAIRFTVSKDPVSDLASSIRTCRKWYRVGMPLLYQNFVMDVNYCAAPTVGLALYPWESILVSKARYEFIPSARFYDTATKLWSQPWTDTGIGYWINSLSVEIHFAETGRRKHRQSITDVISQLPNIRTFSIRAAPLRQNNMILKAKLTDLICNMPSKIVNFELDLQSRDTSDGSTSRQGNHFCKALSKLVPQLCTLRVRLATMCMDFLTEFSGLEEGTTGICPNLKAMSISLYTREFDLMEQCCSYSPAGQLQPPSVKLIDALQARIQDGATFPNLKMCSLICLRNDMAAPMTVPQRVICKNYNPNTRTWMKRAYFPRAEGFAQPWYVRTDPDGDEAETVMQGSRDWEHWNLPGKMRHGKEMDALLEGEAVWTEDAFGARYPPNV